MRVFPSPVPPPSRWPTKSVSTAPSNPPTARATAVTGPRVGLCHQAATPATSPVEAQMTANRPSAATNASVSSGWTACGAIT